MNSTALHREWTVHEKPLHETYFAWYPKPLHACMTPSSNQQILRSYEVWEHPCTTFLSLLWRALLQVYLQDHPSSAQTFFFHLEHAVEVLQKEVIIPTTAFFLARYLVVSFLHPTFARRTFPCFDELQLKATFNVTLVRKSTYSSIFNTALKESVAR